MNYNILVIDDQKFDFDAVRFILSDEHDLKLTWASSGAEGISLVTKNPKKYAVVLTDYEMPNLNGADVTAAIKRINKKQSVIMITGEEEKQIAIDSIKASVCNFFEKEKIDANDFIKTIRGYCYKYDQLIRIAESSLSPPGELEKKVSRLGMVGCSSSLAELSDKVIKIADCDSPILIRGESGTGKELVARAIHQNSSRRKNKFEAINCGAISESLIASELFGHEKGSFTGAISNKKGIFELADRGTIFLDEIGDMPLDCQVKLLRVLQEGVIRPIGSSRTIKVDVRIISATHVDLEKAKAENRFREDLFYRICGIPLDILPLRERREDIAPIVMRTLKKMDKSKAIRFSVLKSLEEYSWPGNVRELISDIEKLVILSEGKEITPDDLDSKYFKGDQVLNWSQFQESLGKEVKDRTREYVLSKLKGTYSIREAARKLNMSKTTLSDKMKYLGISTEEYKRNLKATPNSTLPLETQ